MRATDLDWDGKADLVYNGSARCENVDRQVYTLMGPDDIGATHEENCCPRVWDWLNGGWQMGDVDGDGTPDQVYDLNDADHWDGCSLSDDGNIYIQMGKARGNTSFKNLGKRGARLNPFPAAAYGFFLADMDGDGRSDYVYTAQGGSVRVLISVTGDDAPADNDGIPDPEFKDDDGTAVWGTRVKGISNDECGRSWVADMNADGLADFVYETPWEYFCLQGEECFHASQLRVLLSNGAGFEQDRLWGYRKKNRPESAMGGYLADMNADSLPDFVYVADLTVDGEPRSVLRVLLNTGDGFFDDNSTANWGDFLAGQMYACGSASIVDMTGDGLPDYVYTKSGHQEEENEYLIRGFTTSRQSHPYPDLLKVIHTGLGGSHTLGYSPSTDFANEPDAVQVLPYVVQTLSSIQTDDGNGTVSTTTFSYGGGYHSASRREFRGFERVRRTDDEGATVETRFYQGREPWGNAESDPDCFKGLPRYVVSKDPSGYTYKEVETTYEHVSLYSATEFPRLRQVEERIFEKEADPRIILTTIDEYGSYGNVEKKTSWGDVNDPADGRVERASFSPDTTDWILSRPSQVSVCAESNPSCAHNDPDRLASTSFTYKPGTTLLETKTLWLKGNEAENPVFQYRYDEYGNLSQETDPVGRDTFYTYDSVLHAYVTGVVQEGLNMGSATYIQKFGVMQAKTDANGDTTSFEYDKLGRLTKVIRPGDDVILPGEVTPFGTIRREYEDADLGNVGVQKDVTYQTVKIENGSAETIWKETYFDGLGREIKAKAQAPESKSIVVEARYNARGLVDRKSLPYFEGTETPRYIELTYDDLGRQMTVTHPDDNGGTASTSVSHHADRTVLTDPLGRLRAEYRGTASAGSGRSRNTRAARTPTP